jgi:hypothetical protein
MRNIIVASLACLCALFTSNDPAAGVTFTKQEQEMTEFINWHLYSETATTKDIVRWLKNLPGDANYTLISEIASRAGKNPNLTFSLTATDITGLKNAGASDDLIRAMRSPRWAIAFNKAQLAAHTAAAKSAAAPPPSTANSIQLAANATVPAVGGGASSGSQSNVELIIDASGSMATKIQGRSKMEIAKQALTELLLSLPPTTDVAVRAYGHRSKKDCADIELLANFGQQRSAIAARVSTLKPFGMTPLASSIAEAAKDFAGREGQDNTVILITDGEETCHGDPCAVAKIAHQGGVKVRINVIGFKIDPKERAQLECIAEAGGGKYVSANDAKELTAATQQVTAPVTSNPPPQPAATANPTDNNILAQANGGQVVVAPNDLWTQTNDGKEDAIPNSPAAAIGVGQEAVYAFKDEQPATFDKFATLVPDTSNSNLKEFELLVSDDSPTGNFRSIGRFTVQNAKMLKSPYQEFKFEPVTAKYLKFKAISNYGAAFGDLSLYEFKLFGKTNVASTSTEAQPTEKKAEEANILAQSAGGQVIVAPNDLWTQTNDGKEDRIPSSPAVAIGVGQEAVYAFKDEQPATFDKFATLVPDTSNSNLKELELLISDDSPTGNFRSIGRFTVQNAKMLKSPYQEFKFEPVTAKYLKFKAISNYGASFGDLALYEFKVFGKTNVQSSALSTGASSTASTEERAGQKSGAATATPTANVEGKNILAQSAGGQVLVAPNDLWSQTNDGKEDVITGSGSAYIKVGQEVVYAFKDEQPATFDRFATFVAGTSDSNLKDFELFVANDSPTGNFRSIGTFTVQNVKLIKSPYQEFKFEPVTAKYLKFKALSNYGASFNDLTLFEFKVFGQGNK